MSLSYTVCPGSSYPPEEIFYLFASENEVYIVNEVSGSA